MIDLNLQMFGGGGSGSGGGGTGKNGSGTGKSIKTNSQPGFHGSAGGTKMDGGNENRSESSKSYSVSSPVSRIDDPNATYVLYNSKGKELRSASGKSLLKSIKDETLHYNPRTDKWETSKGIKLIIKKRR